MKKIILFILGLLSAMILLGCAENTNPIVSDESAIYKTSPVYQLYTSFDEINISYRVENTDIYIKLLTHNILNHSNNYFMLVEHNSYNIMYFIDKPNSYEFTIPYFGSNDIVNIKMYAIIIHLNKE